MAFVIGAIVGWLLKPCPCEGSASIGQSTLEVKIDTVEQVITHPPIYVKSKGVVLIDTVEQHDTVIQTHPFVASLDTVVVQDTLNVEYRYPLNTFSVMLRQAPDSIQVEFKTLTLTNTVYEHRPWWIDALTHVGAATLGYAVGSAVK